MTPSGGEQDPAQRHHDSLSATRSIDGLHGIPCLGVSYTSSRLRLGFYLRLDQIQARHRKCHRAWLAPSAVTNIAREHYSPQEDATFGGRATTIGMSLNEMFNEGLSSLQVAGKILHDDFLWKVPLSAALFSLACHTAGPPTVFNDIVLTTEWGHAGRLRSNCSCLLYRALLVDYNERIEI